MADARHTGEENKELVRRFWEDAFNKGDADIVDEIVSSRFRLQDLATGGEMDRDSLKVLVAGLHGHLEEPSVYIRDQWIADQGSIVTQLSLRARPKGSSDTPDEWVELNGVTIDRLSDGRVVETRLMWDAWTANERLRPIFRWRFPWW